MQIDATTIQPKTAVDTKSALQFMREYRAFEKASLADGHRLLHQMCAKLGKHSSYASHICDHWRWKKRQFGAFYLNADDEIRIAFLRMWGIDDPSFQDLRDRNKAAHAALNAGDDSLMRKFLFAPRPPLMKSIDNLLMFFENHGMGPQPAEGIYLSRVPKGTKAYGNARNWADCIMKLPAAEQEVLIPAIINYYPAREEEIKKAKEAAGQKPTAPTIEFIATNSTA